VTDEEAAIVEYASPLGAATARGVGPHAPVPPRRRPPLVAAADPCSSAWPGDSSTPRSAPSA
jgi:hypothetical protein